VLKTQSILSRIVMLLPFTRLRVIPKTDLVEPASSIKRTVVKIPKRIYGVVYLRASELELKIIVHIF